MATMVIMPRQGQSVESCILTQWFKNVGEKVEKGDLLFAYETDKAAFEEEAPVDGILLARFFEEGDEVPVLVNTAVIGEEGESAEDFSPSGKGVEMEEEKVSEQEASAQTPPSEPDKVQDTTRDDQTVQTGGDSVKISPRARKLAAEKRVVFDAIAGSGPGGRIIERDILEEIRNGKRLTPLAQKKLEGEGLRVPEKGKSPYGKITSKELLESAPGPAGIPEQIPGTGFTEVPLSNIRKIIADAMYRSLQNSAQLTHHLGANASRMLRLRGIVKKRMEEGFPANITINDMVCYAVIRALSEFPDVNAHFLGDRVRRFGKVNLGIAVDTDRGLMVPALLNADDLSLSGLSSQLQLLAGSVKKGNVNPDLLSPESATFTVSNLGNYGVEMFTPVINLPQVAILGVNTILQRPTTLEDGSFGFQPFIGLSLTYDHRALDGGPATRFLAAIKTQIETLSENCL
jgi:pyruvate dehydrogenase E2 component (dihydrolipoamide acetyltransferase)